MYERRSRAVIASEVIQLTRLLKSTQMKINKSWRKSPSCQFSLQVKSHRTHWNLDR